MSLDDVVISPPEKIYFCFWQDVGEGADTLIQPVNERIGSWDSIFGGLEYFQFTYTFRVSHFGVTLKAWVIYLEPLIVSSSF